MVVRVMGLRVEYHVDSLNPFASFEIVIIIGHFIVDSRWYHVFVVGRRIVAQHSIMRVAFPQFYVARVLVEEVSELRHHVPGKDAEDVSLVLRELW